MGLIGRAWRAISWTPSQCVLDSARAGLCHQFSSFLWTEFLGVVKQQKASTLVISETHLCFLQITWFCLLHQVVASSSYWSSSQLNVKQREWKSTPPSVRPWLFVGKGWSANSRSERSCCPQWRSLSIFEFCSWARWKGNRRLTDRYGGLDRYDWTVSPGGGPLADPDTLERLYLSAGLGTSWCSKLQEVAGRGRSRLFCSDCCPHNRVMEKWEIMDGWKHECSYFSLSQKVKSVHLDIVRATFRHSSRWLPQIFLTL